MPAPRSPNTDRGGASGGGFSAAQFGSGGGSGAKTGTSAAKSTGGGGASPKGPGASQAAAKANAAKSQASQQKGPVARSVPGTSQAAAKNTALGRAAQAAKQNVARPSGTSTQFGGRTITQARDAQGPIPRNISKESYGWAATGPSRLAAHQGYGIYGGKLALQGETPTQKQFDTMLRANTVTNPAMFNAVGNLSPFMRRNASILTSAARFNNVPNAHALGMGAIESRFGTVRDRPGSQYQGLTQMGNWEFKNYSDATSKALGKTNPWASAQAGTAYMGDLAKTFRDRIGTEPTTGDVYGMYNQGAGGYTSLLRNPDSLAKDVVGFERVRQNLPGHLRAGASTIPAQAFADTIAGYPDKTFARLTGTPATDAPVRVASAAIGSIPRPTPRPANLRSAIPRPNPRPLQSFISGDPRASMAPGAFPAARMQSPVMGDPRVGMPPGAFPAARLQSPVMGDPRANMAPGSYPAAPVRFAPTGDPRVNMPPGSYPAARMQSPVMGDPRVGMPPGAFPAARRTASTVMTDPRVASTPLGAYPAAEQPKLVATMPSTEPMGHWKREEQAYLNQIGAWNQIQADPMARLGYETMQSPYGTGLMVQGVTRDPAIFGSYVPKTNEMAVRTALGPKQYGQTLAHELGHVGSYARAGGYPMGFAQEEVRQRVADTMNTPTFSAQNMDAQGYLANPQLRSGMGMAFTPGLPASMPVKDQSRIAETPGPIQQYGLPDYPGRMPAGTYTAPYDRAPRMSPFGNVGQEYHQHEAPPTPSQYRNEMPPAAPHLGTPASQTAETAPPFWQQGADLFQQAKTAAEPYVKQAQEGSEELRKAVEIFGPKTVLAAIEQKAGKVPQILKGYGEANNQNPYGALSAGQIAVGSLPPPAAATEPQLTPTQMTELLAAMRAGGATPEEIAFVEAAIASQAA